MPDHFLYSQPIPQDAQTRAETSNEQRLNLQSAIDDDASVDVLGSEPGTRTLRVQYRGDGSKRMARQLNELFSASQLGPVAFYGVNDTGNHSRSPEDGYYALDRSDAGVPDGRSDELPYATGTLRPVGTHKSHFRVVTTAPYTPANGNPFGDETTQYFGAPSSITRPQWWNRSPHETEAATPATTTETPWGGVDLYDAADASFDDPSLVFECPYEDEGKFDPIVWDTLGQSAKTRTNGGRTIRNWQHVFRRDHEPQGTLVISNGAIRYRFDEYTNQYVPRMQVESWNDDASAWEVVSLETGNWQFLDLDIREISQQRVWGYVTFTDGSARYDLLFTLQTGMAYAQFTRPDYEDDEIPDPLQTLLDPVASPQEPIVMAEEDLIDRTRVTPN